MSYSVSRESVRRISRQFELEEEQIETVIELLDEGNTIPFLARYRKEKTGGLDENQLRDLEEELEYLSNLEEKKEEVREKIAAQDELTEELKQKLDGAETLQEVEDIYYPYKPRRQTRADKAVERGLEPLAGIIWEQQMSRDELEQKAEEFVDEEQEVETAADALEGARDILADRIAADPELKALSRQRFWQRSELVSEVKDEEADEKGVYEQYYDFSQPVSEIPAFRVLALNRGEDEDILRVKVDPPQESILSRLAREVITKNSSLPGLMEEIIEDAFKRLQGPALEREVRSELTERAEEHAREIFADNLEALLRTDDGWAAAATKDMLSGRVLYRSPSFMRGRTFNDTFLIIDEAQNLSPKQVKSLITRAGRNTKIVCLGNVNQIDSPYLTATTCGMTYLVQRFRRWPHAGHITLQDVERSRLALEAEKLL